ncbi:MAG: LysR family transcriptional regulator [Robiginitomaculum sp.]|nr:LysR family transcriptional regulator [Robiginitomaculum sp.]
MNLRDLKYLVAVADNKHFGKAAKISHVSQPALSMQVQKLESELGVQLLERTNKTVMVTEIGKDIVERARKIIQETEEIKAIAKTHQDPFAGRIRLGAFPTLAPYFFPTIVPKISKALPKLKLFLVEEKTEQLLDQLKNGTLDAAIIALPVHGEQLQTLPLFEDEFLLAVHAKHHLAKRKRVDQSNLEGEPLLLLEEGHCLRNHALVVCSLMQTSEVQDFRATSLETLRQMVASSIGITLIPKIAVQKHKDISYIPFTAPAPSRTIVLVWRKTSARGACFEKIGQLIHAIYMV